MGGGATSHGGSDGKAALAQYHAELKKAKERNPSQAGTLSFPPLVAKWTNGGSTPWPGAEYTRRTRMKTRLQEGYSEGFVSEINRSIGERRFANFTESMKPSVSDAMRKKKSALMRGNNNFGPITPPPRYGEPPMWQATAVAAPLTIDGERNFRELLRTMRVDDLLRMDSYRNSALAYFASRDCVKGCNLVLRFADEKTRVLLAARPNLYGLTALDYARHHHRRGSSIMAVFRHYGVERCVYKREEN